VTCASESSVIIQRNTWKCIPENTTLHNHLCENLKPYRLAGCLNRQWEGKIWAEKFSTVVTPV
jgi:hypothetical protein